MAKPLLNDKHPWQTITREGTDFPISVLTGWYQDGSKEKAVVWKLSFVDRLKALFTGKVILHCIDHLPVHKVSTDYAHLEKMALAWNGDPIAIKKLDSAKPEIVKDLVAKHLNEVVADALREDHSDRN